MIQQIVRMGPFTARAVKEGPKLASNDLEKRQVIADRLLNAQGTLLAKILLQTNGVAGIIREILTFSDENHPTIEATIAKVIAEVEAMPKANRNDAAQAVVGALYQEKIGLGDNLLRATFPTEPKTVEEFAKIKPNGHFDIQQYFNSESWGAIRMTIDFCKKYKEYKKIEPGKEQTRDLENQLSKAYALTLRLAEIFA